jgi:sulfoxide reductase heme-binding subunit YedZ
MRAQAAPAHPEAGRVTWVKERWLTLIVHIGAWLPLLWLIWRWYTDDLGTDPVNTINNVTGRTAIVLLLLCLATTPAYIIFGWRRALTVARPLGVYAFMYAGLHFLNFIGLDYALELDLALKDGVLEKPYIFVGLTALVLLTALAITSTRAWMRRLGKNWKRLHRLVYLIGILVAFHFLWQAKAAERVDPALYGLALLFLLVVRLPPIRKWIVRTRMQLTKGRSPLAPPVKLKAQPIPRTSAPEETA